MTGPDMFIFTGTSGSGRKTIAHKIGPEFGLVHVASCTTRKPRERDISPRDYCYLSEEQFAELEQRGEFLQTSVIAGRRYGVRRSDLEEALAKGRGVYLILNKDGAAVMKQLYGERVVRLFLYVDKQTLRERLESKGMPYDVIEGYLDQYTEEVQYRRACEHVFENVELGRTLDALRTALRKYL